MCTAIIDAVGISLHVQVSKVKARGKFSASITGGLSQLLYKTTTTYLHIMVRIVLISECYAIIIVCTSVLSYFSVFFIHTPFPIYYVSQKRTKGNLEVILNILLITAIVYKHFF